MRPPSPPTDCEIEVLKRFLADPRRPAGTFSYHEMRGFLFVVATAPTLRQPSGWLPVIFGGGEAGFEDLAEAEAIMGTMMGCYNETVSASRSPERVAPTDVGIDTGNDDALRLWATGFAAGIDELDDEWGEVLERLDEHELEHFYGLLSDLTVWADPGASQAALGLSDPEMAERLDACRDLLPELLHWFASIGLGAAEKGVAGRTEKRQVPSTAPGRNDPCPCGSGKKYKRCCGIN